MPKSEQEKLATCIRERGNWGVLEKEHKFDNAAFDPVRTLKDLQRASPKMALLMKNIKELDEKDMKKHGHLFKHFIYSDIKSPYGAKLIAAALTASGFDHAYTFQNGKFEMKTKGVFAAKGKSFATLTSTPLNGKPIGVRFRKQLLKSYNTRPDNVYGDDIRIIVLDSGFREGIDLFDVKYVHLFEPILTRSDEKQAIGRATRYCGQKGLNFDPLRGWPLHVYRYETVIPKEIQRFFAKNIPDIGGVSSFYELFMHYSNIDPRKLAFANELVDVVTEGAIDKQYTRNIHEFKISNISNGGSKEDKYKWQPVKVESICDKPVEKSLSFTPTQELIRDTFTPLYDKHGMLLFHSVGTGKTCTAIATASSTFEPDEYTIIYVTRYTLKADVWKNMFDQVCSLVVQEYLKSGKELPEGQAARMRLISKKWFEPMSYRQFSNMLANKSQLHQDLVKINGTKDILHKTLIIIDEAHKLFAADVEGQEKADIDVIRNALHNSYKTSGKQGAKVLLMTATPYTSEPMDMIRLLNLIRPSEEGMPESFEDFSKTYLDTSGKFSVTGKAQFLNDIEGYISYLNREKDIRSFAYAVTHELKAPMSEYDFKDAIETYIDALGEKKQVGDLLKSKEEYKEDTLRALKRKLQERLDTGYREKVAAYKDCVANMPKTDKKEIEARYKGDKAHCVAVNKECESATKAMYDNMKRNAKAAVAGIKDKAMKQEAKARLSQRLEAIAASLKTDLEKCKTQKTTCEDAAKKLRDTRFEEFNKNTATYKKGCDTLKADAEKFKTEEKERILKAYNAERDFINNELEQIKNRHKTVLETVKKTKDELTKRIEDDTSQMTGVDICFKGDKNVRTLHNALMNYEAPFARETSHMSFGNQEKPVGSKNVFIINGHGSEIPVEFGERMIMPKNKVLVVFAVCNRPNYFNLTCKFVEVFKNKDNHLLLRNPIKNKEAIEQLLGFPIRIYVPGDRVPDMYSDLFLTFLQKGHTILVKSGVHELETFSGPDRAVVGVGKFTDNCSAISGIIRSPMDYTKEVHQEIFKGNLFAPASKALTFKEMQYRRFKIQDVLEDVGDGIYYYTGCRSAGKTKIPANKYERILAESQQQQDKLDDRKDVTSSSPKSSVGDNDPKPDNGDTEESDSVDGNTKEKVKVPKKLLTQAANEIDKYATPLFSADKTEPEDWLEVKDTLHGLLAPLPPTARSVKKLYKRIELMDHVIKYINAAPEKMIVDEAKDGDTHITIRKHNVYVFEGKKIPLHESLWGVIPLNMQSSKYKKCASTFLAQKIVHLFNRPQKSRAVIIPKTLAEWQEDPALFTNICKAARAWS